MNMGNIFFSGKKMDVFEYPLRIDKWLEGIQNAEDFISFIIKNKWVQHSIGIIFSKPVNKISRSFIDDESKDIIRVRVEYHANDYKKSKIKFGNCDLIVSFLRDSDDRVIRGVPVWSFYKGSSNTRLFTHCLIEDIMFDFFNKAAVIKN